MLPTDRVCTMRCRHLRDLATEQATSTGLYVFGWSRRAPLRASSRRCASTTIRMGTERATLRMAGVDTTDLAAVLAPSADHEAITNRIDDNCTLIDLTWPRARRERALHQATVR